NSLDWSGNDGDDETIPTVLVVSQKEVRRRTYGRKSVAVAETSWPPISGYQRRNRTGPGGRALSMIA
ncbi:hypothetical protein TorRG33x02_185490, partial [Trema orientale]